MNVDTIITLAIGLAAAIYIGAKLRHSTQKLFAPSSANGCGGGCSGCGTPNGHADSEEDCTVRETLVILNTKRSSKSRSKD